MAVLDNLQIKATGDVQQAVSGLTQIIDKLKELSAAASKTATAQKTVDKETEKTTKTVNESAKAAAKASNAFSKIASSIGRVAFYRVIRSAIKAVTSAFSEGMQNAYLWSQANDYVFSSVMDTYATRVYYLKNTLGALASTVLEALLPAFQSLTSGLITAINYVNEFIAAITGKNTFLKAKEVAVKYGDSLDDAASKQKKLNIQLMAFDELNNITTPSSSGSDDTKNWLDAFEKANVTDEVRAVGTEVKRIFDTIPWGYIVGAVKQIVEALAPILVDFWTDHGKELIDLVVEINTNLVPAILEIAVALTPVLSWLIRIIQALTLSQIMPVLRYITRSITHITDAIAGYLNGDISRIFEDLANFVLDYLAYIYDKMESAIIGFLRLLSKVPGMGKFGEVADKIEATYVNPFLKAEEAVSGFFDKYRKEINDLNNSASLVAQGIASPLSLVVTKTSENNATYQSHKEKVSDILSGTLGFAGGGFPDMGSVFYAGEVPGTTELLGTINGRTGVASGAEITGIADAVYATGNEEADLLRQILAALQRGGNARPSAAFGRFASQSIQLYKGVTG